MQAAAGKAAANVLRMAGVMAVVEESTVLEDMHIQRASTLMDYYLAGSQRLTEQEPLNKLRAEPDCLLRWLIKKNWPPFRLRDLTRNGPRFARKSTRHTFELLLQLVSHNWLDNDGDIFEVRHVPPQWRRAPLSGAASLAERAKMCRRHCHHFVATYQSRCGEGCRQCRRCRHSNI